MNIQRPFYETNKHGIKGTHLHTMNGQAGARVQLFMAYMTFKVFSLLMLDEDLFVVKVTITIPSV